eukprot:EG_transcript_30785
MACGVNLVVLFKDKVPIYGYNCAVSDFSFAYTSDLVVSPDADGGPGASPAPGCDCYASCGPLTPCSCLGRTPLGCAYNEDGTLTEEYMAQDPSVAYPIFECNSRCSCPRRCSNRIVQKGISCQLEVFPTEGKGFGVRAVAPIPQGAFVCCYIGEVLSVAEYRRRHERNTSGHSLMYIIEEHYGGGVHHTIIDAGQHSNVARLLNHSCAP